MSDDHTADFVIRRLQAALRVSRGWLITCSESAQARRDLKTLDAALALSTPTTPDEESAPSTTADVKSDAADRVTQPGEEARARLKSEIERQCGIGAGEFVVDNETGLWEIVADLDPAGLAQALAFRPSEGEGLREAASVAVTLWRNLTDGDLRMARENCACLGFLLRTGRLPKWEELEAAYCEMNAALKGER